MLFLNVSSICRVKEIQTIKYGMYITKQIVTLVTILERNEHNFNICIIIQLLSPLPLIQIQHGDMLVQSIS